MRADLQRRVQRYGWDRASAHYDRRWRAHLACAQAAMLRHAAPARGEAVLDVACGTGLVSLAAARAVGATGRVLGVDLSQRMVDIAAQQAAAEGARHAAFARMDAEQLTLPDGAFDVALCALGLMYVPDPPQALRELRRVLRPGGRVALAVWGERVRCAWSAVFPLVDAEVRSEVCPLFFHLGRGTALAQACRDAGFVDLRTQRLDTVLDHADADDACAAAFEAGPVALAWSRLDDSARARLHTRYLDAIAPWRDGQGYRLPAEFVVVSGRAPG